MLERGMYRIVQVLDISESLGSQMENSPKEGGIYKCLGEAGQKQLVLYFVDGMDFGQNSVIELLGDLNAPLVYRDEYRVLERTSLTHEVAFIRRLRSGKDCVSSGSG